MKEIKFQDVGNWIFNQNKKKITSARKDAMKRIEKTKKIIEEIKTACYFLQEHADQSVTTAGSGTSSKDVGIRSAKKFSEKVIEKVNELEYPENTEITYEKLLDFKMKFEKILKGDFYNQIGRRFVSKLDKSFRQDISEINYLFKDAGQLFMDIQEIIEKKYKKVKIVEDILNKITKVEQIISDLAELKNSKKEIEARTKEIDSQLADVNSEKESLEQDPKFEKLSSIKKKISINNQKILDIVSPFRKSLKKYSKVGSLPGLQDYADDPVNAYLNDTNTSKFRNILSNLDEAIKTKELKLKSSDERKTIRKIQEFSGRSKVDELREKHFNLQKEKELIQKDLDNSGLYGKFEDLERKLIELDRAKKEIEVSSNKNEEDNDRTITNIADNISSLEEMIFKASNTQVKVVME